MSLNKFLPWWWDLKLIYFWSFGFEINSFSCDICKKVEEIEFCNALIYITFPHGSTYLIREFFQFFNSNNMAWSASDRRRFIKNSINCTVDTLLGMVKLLLRKGAVMTSKTNKEIRTSTRGVLDKFFINSQRNNMISSTGYAQCWCISAEDR